MYFLKKLQKRRLASLKSRNFGKFNSRVKYDLSAKIASQYGAGSTGKRIADCNCAGSTGNITPTANQIKSNYYLEGNITIEYLVCK